MDIYVIAKSGKKTSRANTGDKVFWRFDTSAEARDFISKAKAARSIYEIQELSYSRPDDAKDVYYTYEYVKNSCLNAKFKVGDKVKHKPTGFTGVIIKRNDWDATTEAYDVRSPMTRDIMTWEAEDLVVANAKFKVGDDVIYKGESYVVEENLRNGYVWIRKPGVASGRGVPPEELKKAANSSNPVVANAKREVSAEEKRMLHELTVVRDKFYKEIQENENSPTAERYKKLDADLVRKLESHGGKVKFGGVGKDLILIYNSACTSKNFVVRNAVAWKAKNARGDFMDESNAAVKKIAAEMQSRFGVKCTPSKPTALDITMSFPDADKKLAFNYYDAIHLIQRSKNRPSYAWGVNVGLQFPGSKPVVGKGMVGGKEIIYSLVWQT